MKKGLHSNYIFLKTSDIRWDTAFKRHTGRSIFYRMRTNAQLLENTERNIIFYEFAIGQIHTRTRELK